MKRDIKFKFWLGHTKKMTYPHFLNEVGTVIPFFSEDIITLQYTGLKDKDGNEIYEGDILLTWYSRDTSGKDIIVMTTTVEHQVEHESTGFEIQFLHTAKVIGNIYENPDLLDTEEAQLSEPKVE